MITLAVVAVCSRSMGVDKRGKDRGSCRECDCSDYEQPSANSQNARCSYCECPPTRHQVGFTCTRVIYRGSHFAIFSGIK